MGEWSKKRGFERKFIWGVKNALIVEMAIDKRAIVEYTLMVIRADWVLDKTLSVPISGETL